MHSCHCVYTQRDVHRLCEQSAKKIYRFYNMVESILFFCLPYFNLTLDDYAIMHECALLHRMGSNDGDMSRGEINELLPFEKCWMNVSHCFTNYTFLVQFLLLHRMARMQFFECVKCVFFGVDFPIRIQIASASERIHLFFVLQLH